jgi:hypothetical protein
MKRLRQLEEEKHAAEAAGREPEPRQRDAAAHHSAKNGNLAGPGSSSIICAMSYRISVRRACQAYPCGSLDLPSLPPSRPGALSKRIREIVEARVRYG